MKKISLLPVFLVFIAFTSSAQSDIPGIKKEKYNESKNIEDEIGYTHAVKVDNVLYISGSVGDGETMAEQIRSLMESIKKTLSNYRAGFNNVVKETVFTTNLDEFIQNKSIRNSYYSNDFPAATWVQVSRLYLPKFKVEIEVIAYLPK
jgi:2-iminobutanoate/2-iminopropanoate deaminase